MDIVKHPACTHDLGAPADMQDGSCEALPVLETNTPHGIFTCSFWRPSAEELAALNAGSVIQLAVRAQGRQHPVVAMAVTQDPV